MSLSSIIWKVGNRLPKKVRTRCVAFLRIKASLFYSDEFFERHLEKQWLKEANLTVKILFDVFHPKSVVDFGCGVASYLHFFSKLGVEVRGYDKSKEALKHSLVNQGVVIKHDLRKPLQLTCKYDLAICFEVLEHISRKYEDQVLNTLCSFSDIICLSAAIPGQGGMEHINERPHEYWIRKMRERNFHFERSETLSLRAMLESEIKEMPWIKQNLMVFRKA